MKYSIRYCKILFLLVALIYYLSNASYLTSAEIKTNDKAPNITLRNINNRLIFGKTILKDKPILAAFFFTDCLPCKKEIPELEALNKKYGEKIKMFLIATDKEGADAVIPYIGKMNITIDVLIDKYSDAARDFGVTQYPSLFIIGKDGKVLYSCYGYKQENISNIERIINGLK
jgi:peroxiredoxin